MATSGSKSVTVTSHDTLKFSWSESSQSVSANTTTITWKMQLITDAYGRISSSVSKKWSVTVNGTKYSGTNSVSIGNNATKTLASGTTVISHNSDGTKSFSYSFSQTFDITFSGSTVGTKSGSGTGTLDTIPRATTPTVSSSSVYMGSAVTINTPRASSSFTHDLAYSFAGGSYVSITTGAGTSYSWTTPDLASKIPSATSGTVTIRCITKNGSTTIGTKTVTMTLKVPTSVVPTISAVATEEATSGLAAQFGAFIKSKSKIKATITAAGAKGSTIKSYSTTFNGKTYTGSSWTSSAVTASGSLSLVTTVTDSRGRTAKKTTTITVLNYSAPSISALRVYRMDEAGATSDDGIYIAVRYTYSVTSLNSKNTARMVIEYKKSTETEWAELLTGSALSANTTAQPASPTFSTDYQYDVRMTVTDWFGASQAHTATLPSGAVVLDIAADGEGLAVGKTSEHGGFESGWRTHLWEDGKTVLWSGGKYMTADHTVNLSEPISKQNHGIVLIFSRYGGAAAQNDNFASFFVPKYLVEQIPGAGHNFFIAHSSFEYVGAKYLYISDEKIVGHANNNLTGTGAAGITYENNRFVLRYVIGV